MNDLFLTSLTKAINAYLDLDPESKHRIHALHGKAFAIEFLPLHFTFQCVFDENTISIKQDESIEIEAKICGTPLQMLGVMMTKENRQRFFADDLTITGNAEFAEQVINLFDHLQIDWEEYTSHILGDVPTYHANRMLKKFGHWLKQTTQSLTDNVNEYVHEEAQWLPAREALQDFFTDIDTLRMDVDRIEARIQHLKLQMEDDAP